jgi:hypothetical protein
MPAVARYLCFRSTGFLAELAAILLAGQRHTEAREMRALLGLICHLLLQSQQRGSCHARWELFSGLVRCLETPVVWQQFEQPKKAQGDSGNDKQTLQALLYVRYSSRSIAFKAEALTRKNAHSGIACGSAWICIDTADPDISTVSGRQVPVWLFDLVAAW